MKLVPLTKGQFAMVDDEDFDRISQYSWRCWVCKATGQMYADTKIKSEGVWTRIKMHRFILPHNLEHTDHKDGNGLNNQKCNLRPATRIQNAGNVHFQKAAQKWQSYIRINKALKHLGYFTSEREAAMAYDSAALLHFGEFARTNQQMGAL